MKNILTSFSILILLLSCVNDKKDAPKEEKKPLTFTTKTIEKKLEDCEPEEGDCTFINLTFPVAENGTGEAERINKKIEDFIVRTIDYQDEENAEKAEQLAENFIEDYKEAADEFPEYELAWEATINGKVNYRSPAVISIKFNTSIFTGGAHGYRSTNYINFNPETGRILTSADLFTKEFVDFVERDFREKNEIPLDDNINSTGLLFENDEFHLPANIGFSENEVILHYNAYDIAPYSAGNFVFIYSKAEVEQYLKISETNENL